MARLTSSLAVVAAFALLVVVPSASASTLESSADGTLTFAAAPGIDNEFELDEAGGTVSFNTVGDPVTGAVPGTCSDTSGGAMESFDCTGVTAFSASLGAGEDSVDLNNGGGLTSIPGAWDLGPGDDFFFGGEAPDTVSGGDGSDSLAGGPGSDVVRGGADDDVIDGDCGFPTQCGSVALDGNDTLEGGEGDDGLRGALGDDSISGGGGVDSVNYYGGFTPAPLAPAPVSVTLDGLAGDGRQGQESDNVRTDVEDVVVDGSEPSAITGNSEINALVGGEEPDTIGGAAGNDFLYGFGGSDTINARDGFADRVVCGTGADTANVDTLDTVVSGCEIVNRVDVGNANDVPEIPEDAPPKVTFESPAAGARLATNAPTLLLASATDDRGIAQVLFLDDDRVVCADTTAPYTCDYSPRGGDVGRNTLLAVAIDGAQQTATAARVVTVPRFPPRSLTILTSPKRDTTSPFAFTAKGKLSLPAGVDRTTACSGSVAVRYRSGHVSFSQVVKLSKSCSYRSRVRLRIPPRQRPRSLAVRAVYTGGSVLSTRSSKTVHVRIR